MPAADRGVDVGRLPSLRAEPCAYPDARPPEERQAYVYARGRAYPLGVDRDPAAMLLRLGGAPPSGRIPVLAVGSNAYPRQLLDKFREHPLDDDSVPTLACMVADAAVSYVAALSRWGYVPVGLRPRPGARCATWLQLLTPAQLAAIAATEGAAYRLVRVPGVVAPALGGLPSAAYGWAHERLLALGSSVVDVTAMSQARLLAELIRGLDAGLEWDGCRVPAGAQERLRARLRERGTGNDLPSSWAVVERGAGDFPARLAP